MPGNLIMGYALFRPLWQNAAATFQCVVRTLNDYTSGQKFRILKITVKVYRILLMLMRAYWCQVSSFITIR